MIDELYAKFKQTLPKDSKPVNAVDKIAELAEAIKNRRVSGEVWTKAKAIVRDKLKGDTAALDILDSYFGKGTKPPFSDKTLNQAIDQGMKDLNLKIGQIVKDYYETGLKDRGKLVDYSVNVKTVWVK